MKSLNKVTLIGNLGRDPEMRRTNSGDPVVNMSIACGESWKDKNTGEQREKTEWVNIVIFGPLADIADKYLRKGSRCYVEGSLQTRKWQDKDGHDRYSTEVVLKQYRGDLILLDNRERSGDSASGYSSSSNSHTQAPQQQRKPAFDDEIPF